MRVISTVPDLAPDDVREMLSGLPEPGDYAVRVKPLRYRDRPHLAALTDFEARAITLQVPEPFFPFGEIVPYGAKRRSDGKGTKPRFIWLTEGITLRTREEVLRFAYCHEWMHWWLKEVRGTASAAETTCDRFALLNYLRPVVSEEDALRALRRRSDPVSSSRSGTGIARRKGTRS